MDWRLEWTKSIERRPGTYTVTVTETTSGCTSRTDFTINASTNITAGGSVKPPTCGQTNGSISVTPSTGSTYAWTGGLSGQNPLNVARNLYSNSNRNGIGLYKQYKLYS
ncbi:MAG: hypothetical protein IPO14_07890 [Saprospiraceae bacterium]|nr:hypothetical protein [Saprospiraceae bacterium]